MAQCPLAGDIVLYSWARHFTVRVPLSTQVYTWVPVNLMLGVTMRWTSIPSRGGVEILLVDSCYRNQDKFWPDEPLGPYEDFTLCLSSLKILYNIVEVTHLQDSWEKGGLKHGTPLCRLLRNACSASFCSQDGSIRQNDPFPGSS